jgi:hypothetical protein
VELARARLAFSLFASGALAVVSTELTLSHQ